MAARQMAIVGALRQRPVLSLYGLMIISLVALLPLPPLLQDQTYHQFADQRELFGIPNFWNVISNLPFVAVGSRSACGNFTAMRQPPYCSPVCFSPALVHRTITSIRTTARCFGIGCR